MAATTNELTLQCNGCGAGLYLAPTARTATCPYCDSHSVVERPPTRDRPDPAYTIPFVFSRRRAQDIVRKWIGRRGLFADSGLARAVIEHVRGVYLPAYLYTATAEASYTVEIGERYTVSDGKSSSGRTEWCDLAGRYNAYVPDVLVSASRSIRNLELETIEPFDLRELVRYDAALISGWVAEEPSRTRDECFELGQKEALDALEHQLDEFMPGDRYRALRYRVHLRDQNIELLLLPVWTCAVRYREDRAPLRVLVNGQGGHVAGKIPRSATKIGVAVGIGLLFLMFLVLWLQGVFR